MSLQLREKENVRIGLWNRFIACAVFLCISTIIVVLIESLSLAEMASAVTWDLVRKKTQV